MTSGLEWNRYIIKGKIMKFMIQVLAMILMSFSTVNSQQTAVELDVMSFNIRYGTAKDGDNHWKHRKDQLLELLSSSSPDIIGLQEVLKFQLDEIMDHLPDYAMIGVSREGNWQDEFSAILYKKSKFNPKKTNTYWLSDTPQTPSKGWGNDIMRIVSWAEFKHIKSDRSFYFYNAHFDHISQTSREKGAAQLIKIINNRDHDYPVIITGDFNALVNITRPLKPSKMLVFVTAIETCPQTKQLLVPLMPFPGLMTAIKLIMFL